MVVFKLRDDSIKKGTNMIYFDQKLPTIDRYVHVLELKH